MRIVVEEGQHVHPGKELTEGDKNPADILRINGIDAVYNYIILEVQKVYRSQSININDKHIEVIARQMTRKIRVVDQGDTSLLSGSMVNIGEFMYENEEIQRRIDAGERTLLTATGESVLLGITKASLQTESFLSAASFQETTKVLTEAAIKGKVDHLLALKENVIIGKLIPAGTGMQCYRDVEVEHTVEPESPFLDLDMDLDDEYPDYDDYDDDSDTEADLIETPEEAAEDAAIDEELDEEAKVEEEDDDGIPQEDDETVAEAAVESEADVEDTEESNS